MSAIIVLTIGPVQSYISQARRTQDLWQGSRILSYLASQGIKHALEQKPHTEMIYPDIDPNLQTDNIPNRMVVKWDGDEAGAKDCAEKMEEAIREAWLDVSTNTINYFTKGLVPKDFDKIEDIWNRQRDNWLECYWVVVPESSGAAIQKANELMGARKLLRTFPHIEEFGRKCSITGEHEALRSATEDYIPFWRERRKGERNRALLGANERLSAISTIKRFAHEERTGNKELEFPNRLPSTSSMAVVPFKYELMKALYEKDSKDSEHEALLQVLLQALKSFIASLLNCYDEDHSIPISGKRNPAIDLFFTKEGNFNPEHVPMIEDILKKNGEDYTTGTARNDPELWATQLMCIDGDYFLEDTLIPKTIAEYLPTIDAKDDTQRKKIEDKRIKLLQPKVAKALEALQKLTRAASKLKIATPKPYFVILSMDGDHMGKTLSALDGKHQLFSETLAGFARNQVKDIVENQHLGRLVYAGGDDVLALLPVRDALEVAEQLRTEFQKIIAAKGITNHEGKLVTASTGVAYVHHTHNLQEAVQTANNAQHYAKDHYDRNAICVEFLRRSGEPRKMGHKWLTESGSTVSLVSDLIAAFKKELSRSLPTDVARIAYSMKQNVPEEAAKLELERVLRRRLDIEDKANRLKKAESLRDDIMSLKAHYSWDNVQRWLELARFIAQSTEV